MDDGGPSSAQPRLGRPVAPIFLSAGQRGLVTRPFSGWPVRSLPLQDPPSLSLTHSWDTEFSPGNHGGFYQALDPQPFPWHYLGNQGGVWGLGCPGALSPPGPLLGRCRGCVSRRLLDGDHGLLDLPVQPCGHHQQPGAVHLPGVWTGSEGGPELYP
uniref:cDNA: FLJ23412 fis, clone HEP20516 n=1 Tax=Homo sapiens TaxID=9606 RepID=Q9H5I2_HUMAN|nr:unnamed protein product [Homo sapiens]